MRKILEARGYDWLTAFPNRLIYEYKLNQIFHKRSYAKNLKNKLKQSKTI